MSDETQRLFDMARASGSRADLKNFKLLLAKSGHVGRSSPLGFASQLGTLATVKKLIRLRLVLIEARKWGQENEERTASSCPYFLANFQSM